MRKYRKFKELIKSEKINRKRDISTALEDIKTKIIQIDGKPVKFEMLNIDDIIYIMLLSTGSHSRSFFEELIQNFDTHRINQYCIYHSFYSKGYLKTTIAKEDQKYIHGLAMVEQISWKKFMNEKV